MPKSDSSITATFTIYEHVPEQKATVYNVIIVDAPEIEKDYTAETFIVPIIILVVSAFVIFFTLMKIKPGSKTDAILDKIESKIPKFLRF